MKLGTTGNPAVMINDLFDGLYLYQELGDHYLVLIFPDKEKKDAPVYRNLLNQSPQVICAVKKTDSKPHQAQVDNNLYRAVSYQKKEELISLVSSR